MSIGVIAPDRPSGDAFVAEFVEAGVETIVFYPDIAPRVVGETISRDPRVTDDLQAAIYQATETGVESITIACNTLQLWLDKVKSPIPVTTTFEVLKEIFPDRTSRPLWLGTTALVSEIGKDFDTLLTMGRQDLQQLVQEIIWRVKAVSGARYNTAFTLYEPKSREVLRERVGMLAPALEDLGLEKVILGCTELPIAFQDYMAKVNVKKIHLELIDPAYHLAKTFKLK